MQRVALVLSGAFLLARRLVRSGLRPQAVNGAGETRSMAHPPRSSPHLGNTPNGAAGQTTGSQVPAERNRASFRPWFPKETVLLTHRTEHDLRPAIISPAEGGFGASPARFPTWGARPLCGGRRGKMRFPLLPPLLPHPR